MCTCKEFSQHFIPPLLIYYSSQQKVFKFVYQHRDSYQGQALQDLIQHWIARITVVQHPSHCPKASRDTCRSVYPPHYWKNAEFYRLQELVMYRLHIVNSFTVMEIPNAVWPWKRIRSPFKGLSSEFPALAFSYCLSQLFWVHLCSAAGLGDGMGGKKEGVIPE